MDIEYIKQEANDLEVRIPEVTLAEILRVYLNEDSAVTFAAWRRFHPTEAPTLAVKTKGKDAKKALLDALSLADKELASVEKTISSLK